MQRHRSLPRQTLARGNGGRFIPHGKYRTVCHWRRSRRAIKNTAAPRGQCTLRKAGRKRTPPNKRWARGTQPGRTLSARYPSALPNADQCRRCSKTAVADRWLNNHFVMAQPMCRPACASAKLYIPVWAKFRARRLSDPAGSQGSRCRAPAVLEIRPQRTQRLFPHPLGRSTNLARRTHKPIWRGGSRAGAATQTSPKAQAVNTSPKGQFRRTTGHVYTCSVQSTWQYIRTT